MIEGLGAAAGHGVEGEARVLVVHDGCVVGAGGGGSCGVDSIVGVGERVGVVGQVLLLGLTVWAQ